jgi:hypothetical protein
MDNEPATPSDASQGGQPHQSDRDYEVGYGKPPKHTRFKKSRSGNPKNRRGREKTLGKLLTEVLDEKVTVTEPNGRKRKISKIDAMFTQVANRAAQGNPKATQALLRVIQTFHRQSPKAGSNDPALPRDRALALILTKEVYSSVNDPELTRRLVRTARDWEIEQQQKQNPGNDNYDDSVWKLKKR